MHETTLLEMENLFLALSDKTRLRLLALMADGEVPVGFLADELGESQPKTSRHLAYLRTAGLVSTRREGKWVYYGIERPDDIAVASVFDATLRSMTDNYGDQNVTSYPGHQGDAYRDYNNDADISAEAYMNEWSPNELEVFLL